MHTKQSLELNKNVGCFNVLANSLYLCPYNEGYGIIKEKPISKAINFHFPVLNKESQFS